MGALVSCCCGRRRKPDGEKEPLLPRYVHDAPPRRESLQKTATVLAALSTGKVPSQDQINDIVRALQRSILETEDSIGVESGNRYGPLSARGRLVLDDARELCQAILQFGLEKNFDDVVQEFWYHCSQVDDAVRVPPNPKVQQRLREAQSTFAHAAPVESTSAEEVNTDIDDTVAAVRTLFSLLITSSAFRLILSDVLLTSRQIVADFAANVASVAAVVENQAMEVDEIVRPVPDTSGPEGVDALDTDAVKNKGADVKSTVQDIPSQLATGVDGTTDIVPESAERIRQTLVDRVKSIVVQAQSDPAYKTALVTIFDILHKYVERAALLSEAARKASETATADADTLADMAPVTIEMNPELDYAVETIRKLLNRFGEGVDPIISTWKKLAEHAYADPGELENYLFTISSWLRHAMNTPQWINTDEASAELGQLHDRGQAMLDLDPELKNILRSLIDQAEAFVDALKNDKSINRLIQSVERLSQHAKDLGFTGAKVAAGQQDALREARQEIWHDVVGWLVPRLLRAVKAIPIPRVEYTSEMVDLVIDDLVLTAPSFIPDHLVSENSSSIHVLGSEALDVAIADGETPRRRSREGLFDSEVRLESTTRIRIDGLRLSAKLISYFADVRYSIFGWRDNGLLSFDIGTAVDPELEGGSSEGLSLDIQLATAAPDARSFYDVQKVAVDVPGLAFGISKSRHWLVNALLQPFIGPVGRRVGSVIAANELKKLLASGDEQLFKMHERAVQITAQHQLGPVDGEERIQPSLATYWAAFLEIQAESLERAEEEAEAAAKADPTSTESEIHATPKGVVRTSRVEGPQGDVEAESSIAVGVGAQLLPGRGGPDTTDEGRGLNAIAEEANEALDEVGEAVEVAEEIVVDVAGEARDVAREAKENLASAAETYERRKKKEKKRGGWRSEAFNI